MPPEHFDVVIVGAGLSGIGAGCHLTEKRPGTSFAILESRESMGGTWDLFRYPGIRSDSDMFTLGYSFRPWDDGQAIADGPSILRYICETAREYGVDEHIRYHHRVVRAEWSSEEARWRVEVERGDTGDTVELTCGFLFGCGGYYRYDQGYLPPFEGIERFKGTLVHPQHWPDDLDYAGKRVVVIGSGSTAVTLVPAMAERAAHVTMLQRSPTYIASLPSRDAVADALRRRLPAMAAYRIVRAKNVLRMQLSYKLSRRAPRLMKALIRAGVRKYLPREFDPHFSPRYDPWDQRLCLAPDGDLFTALQRGDASIVTDEIETFTERGVKLASGDELEADIIVTSTGLDLQLWGGMSLTVDGREIEPSETVGYKGMMFSGVPNFVVALGYTNASWTLKADLVSDYVCRLLEHMERHGYRQCTPREPDPSVGRQPIIDLKAGYVLRKIDSFPKQGSRSPWRLHQNYLRDLRLLRHGPLEDEGIEFSSAPAAAPRGKALAA